MQAYQIIGEAHSLILQEFRLDYKPQCPLEMCGNDNRALLKRMVMLTDLCKQHESIVCSQVLFKELHTVSLQGWHCIFLSCVQSGHHRLRPYLDLIGIQEPREYGGA